MIIDLMEGDYESLKLTLFVITIVCFSVMLAVGVDLYYGIQKARSIGEATTSEGFRRTITKLTYYLTLVFFGVLIDIFDVVTPYIFGEPLNAVPFATVIIGVGLIITEMKSVNEKAEDKLRRRAGEGIKDILTILKDRQDIIDKLIDVSKEDYMEDKTKHLK